MAELTKERLEEIHAEYSKPNHSKSFSVKDREIAEMARQLIASMEQEPVAWEVKGILCRTRAEANVYVGEPEPLYAAPQLPQPAVVMTFDEWSRKCDLQLELCDSDLREKARYIWDEACRSAMLQGAEPVTDNTSQQFESLSGEQ